MEKKLTHSSGTIEFTKSGNAFLISESKQIQKDIFIPKGKTGKALNGDIVFVKLTVKADKSEEYIGEVVSITKRFKTEFVGVIEYIDSKAIYIVKSFSKKVPVEFFVPTENLGGAVLGDKVLLKLSRWNASLKKPVGVVTRVFGKAGDHSTEMNSILFENNIDSTFPKAVIDESEKIPFEISEEEIAKREDFRDVMTFTIDGADTRDIDDALSIRSLDNGNYEIGIHIADVSHYVKNGSKLEKEALKRGTSVYLVDRVIPMFPEKLSNGVCSLNPNVYRLSFSIIFEITINGVIINSRFSKTIIHSQRKLTYDQVQYIIENNSTVDGISEKIVESVKILNHLATFLRIEKNKHGALNFSKKEIKFKLDSEGIPTSTYFKEQKEANFLIEEFMLLANRTVGKYMSDIKKPAAYRIHNSPSIEKLEELSSFVKNFGYDFIVSNDKKEVRKQIIKLLFDIKGKSEENMISTIVIRSMAKAVFSTNNIGHFGLGEQFDSYIQWTSPIRRFLDYKNHQILASYLPMHGYVSK